MKFLGVLVILMTLTVSGCSSFGPMSSPTYLKQLEQAVPTGEGQAKYLGAAEWFANSSGSGHNASDVQEGGLVITDRAILFAHWNDKRETFDVIKRIAIEDLVQVRFDSQFYLVVRRKDLSYDSFVFFKDGAVVARGDRAKTEQSVAYLMERIKEQQ